MLAIEHALGTEGLAVVLLLCAACGEPCLTQKTVQLDPSTNPFSDHRSLLSLCDACPIDPSKTGSALAQCGITFAEGGGAAGCVYKNADGFWSGPEVRDIPNPFSFCEQTCEEGDALHQCGFTVDASNHIITPLTCEYGHTCD